MRKFVIERDMPGIGTQPAESYCAGTARSNKALDEVGKGIQWVESFVTDDKVFCLYLAEDERLIRDHAERSGFPATRIHAVRTVMDPTTTA